ncbi:hypothetical protein E1281_07865 [Actinomadura sp. KC345]|uniref:hypothetical protein n=1 Tax=Actinomadura sp. KC345 TaxID=2530371 RepID=UPI001049FBD8|nr:hypothetical protein [Actinomadura sp. KC345]TDC56330.1 hypothetical protein E1281_07865 [Actinomadura sp. KC345]
MPHRVRRVGTASAAVSAGALVLLLAAPASQAAAAEVCKKGVDPETTIENWKCNLGNMREALTPKTPTPTPKPTQSKTTKKTTASKNTGKRTSKAPARRPRTPASAPSGGGAPAPPATMTGSRVPQPYSENAPATTPGLPGVLPTPEIAADPNAYQDPQARTVAGPRTRLVSPVAASQRDDGRMLLVAAAAGAAGAVGALNLSVLSRGLRHRRT